MTTSKPSTSPPASGSAAAPSPKPTTPHRQIRALYNNDTITVYQAYHASIALPAVQSQNLAASPTFRPTRMTWIKPSFCWMMYRAGYSHKDARQAHILAIRLRHADFLGFLRKAVLTHGGSGGSPPHPRGEGGDWANAVVRVQWDPERDARVERLDYRSIQIGISAGLSREYTGCIVGIEDVTAKARELKTVLDGEEDVSAEELVRRGLVPEERVYEVPDDLRKLLCMD